MGKGKGRGARVERLLSASINTWLPGCHAGFGLLVILLTRPSLQVVCVSDIQLCTYTCWVCCVALPCLFV